MKCVLLFLCLAVIIEETLSSKCFVCQAIRGKRTRDADFGEEEGTRDCFSARKLELQECGSDHVCTKQQSRAKGRFKINNNEDGEVEVVQRSCVKEDEVENPPSGDEGTSGGSGESENADDVKKALETDGNKCIKVSKGSNTWYGKVKDWIAHTYQDTKEKASDLLSDLGLIEGTVDEVVEADRCYCKGDGCNAAGHVILSWVIVMGIVLVAIANW